MASQSTDPNKPNYVPSSILGYDPRQAYNAYVAAVAQQNNNYTGGHDIEQQALPFDAWFTAQARNAGTYGIANLIQLQYANATGREITPAQSQQMYRVIAGLPPTTQQAILAAGGTDYLAGSSSNVKSLLSAIQPLQDFLYGTSSGVAGSAPALTPEQARQQSLKNSIASQYQSIFGKAPSDAQVNSMMGMNARDQQNYLNNQQYKMGLTYGQWTVAEGNINKQYMQYFGRNATDEEVAWANGKSVDDIQSHIMDSPSRVDGLKMGQYMNYKQALDDESTKQFGYAAPDEMIKAFHTATLGQHAGV